MQSVEILTPSQLVEKTKIELKGQGFGSNIFVIEPPAAFVEAQRVIDGEGFLFMEPLYFPLGETRLNSSSPDGWVKLERWFFDQIKKGAIDPDALRIGAFWALFDKSERPGYNRGTQMFKGDEQIGLILAQARGDGQIATPDHVKHLLKGSRFGVSMDEQDQVVFPRLAKKWRLVEAIDQGEVRIRRPNAGEFNFAGNLRYKHLGKANTWEGFNDRFEDGCRLIGGCSDSGGLSFVDYCLWSGGRNDDIAFRPLVEFSSQHQSLITW